MYNYCLLDYFNFSRTLHIGISLEIVFLLQIICVERKGWGSSKTCGHYTLTFDSKFLNKSFILIVRYEKMYIK